MPPLSAATRSRVAEIASWHGLSEAEFAAKKAELLGRL
jgi:hypothetical protein